MKDKRWIIISAVLAGILAAMLQASLSSNGVANADRECEKAENYVDEKTFKMLKEAYYGIDFYGEFKKGDTAVYDYYKEMYAKLLSGEAKITEEGKEKYGGGEEQNLEYYRYDISQLASSSSNIYYFDMDEDNLPELCIAGIYGTYVFKYIPETGQYMIWWGDMASGGSIAGSRKIHYGSDDSFYIYREMKENGDTDFSVVFKTEVLEADKEDWKYFYMVSFPEYRDQGKKIPVSEELKRQSCGIEGGIYYFRVTEKQYKELTEEYFDAAVLSYKERVHLSYFLPEQDRIYSSQYHFPDDMAYVDEPVFKMLDSIYQELEFYGEFKKGDPEAYDYYKDKYAELLNGEKKCTDQYNEEADLDSLKDDSAQLYYFDMDGDNLPELCFLSEENSYIFKYISNIDQYRVWWEDWAASVSISGSGKIRNVLEGSFYEFYDFYEMKEDGTKEYSLVFGTKESEDGVEPLYMVSMPLYNEETRKTKIPHIMEKQSYMSAEEGRYFFRVTKKQYEKLTKEYFETAALCQKECVPLSFFLSGNRRVVK